MVRPNENEIKMIPIRTVKDPNRYINDVSRFVISK
jgi:hypothetical protein